MSVSLSLTLPGQPAAGLARFTPLGGNGKQAPLGCYFVDAQLDGDASAGTASVVINTDPRYANLIAYANPVINVDAGAGDFLLRIATGSAGADIVCTVVGTLPGISASVSTDNSAFLWYPPPFYLVDGNVTFIALNVAATETYILRAQIYCFDIDVTHLTPLPFLQMNVPGVSAPAAV